MNARDIIDNNGPQTTRPRLTQREYRVGKELTTSLAKRVSRGHGSKKKIRMPRLEIHQDSYTGEGGRDLQEEREKGNDTELPAP